MIVAQGLNDDRSSSADFGSTLSSTPEGSTPTTTTGTEALSCCQRLRLQREPWVRYFQTNKIRIILSGLFLLIHLAFLVCRLVLHFEDHKRIFSICAVGSGSIGFSIFWGKRKNSVRRIKPSWFQRLLLQKEPWTLHLKNYALECTIALVLFAVFLTLVAFRLFTTVDDPPTFSIAAAFSYALGFAFAWLLIPEAPPFLATPDGLPVFKAFPMKWKGQSFKNI